MHHVTRTCCTYIQDLVGFNETEANRIHFASNEDKIGAQEAWNSIWSMNMSDYADIVWYNAGVVTYKVNSVELPQWNLL